MISTRKICIIGDSDSGKTTFIKLMITGIYTEKNEKKISKIVIDPSKFNLKYYRIPIEIIDGSNSYEKEDLEKLLHISNVVVIFYDFQNPNSFLKIKQEILPLALNFDNIYSIIIVGNKFDLLDSINQKFAADKDKEEIQNILIDEKANVKYYAISCLNYLNISDLVYEMLDSLVNPTKILVSYENSEENYNKDYIKGLTRIFRIFDKNNTGVLTNHEFMDVHKQIFDLTLDSDHMLAIKELLKIVKNKVNGNYNSDAGIDLEGFIVLNKVSVNINETQITWNILRKYGYNDELDIDNSYLLEKNFIFDTKYQYIHQLSETTVKRLSDIFHFYSIKVGDTSVLTNTEWESLFYPCFKYFPLEEVLKNYNITRNHIEFEDFLYFWSSLCKISPLEAYKLFLGVGFDLNYLEFCSVTPKSYINLFQKLPFKCYHICFVITKDELRAFLNIIFDKNEEKILNYESSSFKYIPIRYGNNNFIFSFEFVFEIAVGKSKEVTNNWHKYDLFILSDTIYQFNINKYFEDFPYIIIYMLKPFSDTMKVQISELYLDQIQNVNSIFDKINQFIQEPILFLNEKNRTEVNLKKKKKFIRFSLNFIMFTLFIGAAFFGSKYFHVFKRRFINK